MPPRSVYGTLVRLSGLSPGSDAELLGRFVRDRDGEAFAELVRRHGPMVFGVCRRLLGNRPDADDAFQATFLVLVRRAGAVSPPGAVGNWLYGVAVRTAVRAKSDAIRRRNRQHELADVPDPRPATAVAGDLAAVIDAELARLPDKYRAAVVLCELEGRSLEEAAAALGVPVGTAASRLARGRKRLAVRLTRRGLGMPAAGLAAAIGPEVVAVPPPLLAAVFELAQAGASGGAIPANVEQLATEGVWPVGKAKLLAAAVVAAGLGVGTVAGWQGEKPAPPAKETKADPLKPAAESKPAVAPVKRSKPRLMWAYPIRAVALAPPVWSPNNDWFAVPVQDHLEKHFSVVMGCRDAEVNSQRRPAILVGDEDDEGTRPGTILGFSTLNGPDHTCLATTKQVKGTVNADHRLLFWQIPIVDGLTIDTGRSLTVPKGSTGFDPGEDEPFALTPDGKSALCRNASGVHTLDLTTGEVGKTLFEATDLGMVTATPDARHVASLKYGKDSVTIRAWDAATGRRKWERTVSLPGASPVHGRPPIAISPDGRLIAACPEKPNVKANGQSVTSASTVVLFDGETGADGAALEGQQRLGFNGLYNFSHDGRLLAGYIDPENGSDSQLVVWDTATGKVLKKWPGAAQAAFAPDRPALAVVENVSAVVEAKLQTQSTFGLWDVSPLLK